MNKVYNGIKNCVKKNKGFYAVLGVTAVTAVILLSCVVSADFADKYSSSVSFALRFVLALITSVLPFSLAELVIILLIPSVILSIYLCVKKKIAVWNCLKTCIVVLLVAAILFINTFGVCYFCNSLDLKLGLERTHLDRQEIYIDAVYTRNLLENAADKITFAKDGSSVNPHTWRETNKLIDKGYDSLREGGVYNSYIIGSSKPILLSEPMTYTHISGMYFPFTGEANINTNYPDYVVAFTIAHEKAHQRGIAREDEANFMAFLACMASDDEYLKYAALMNMYDYFLDETFDQDVEIYNQLVDETDSRIIGEMYSYYKFFKKYNDSSASRVTNRVNDTYIKAMGDDEGIKSYGLVIELYHAYIEKEK